VTVRQSLEYGAFRFARAAVTVLPEWLVMASAAGVGWLAGSALRIRRRDVDRHVERAFPHRPAPWRRRVARRSYVHLAREAATIFRMSDWTREEILARADFQGVDEIRDAAAEGGGVLVLTCHVGNWEFAGALGAAVGLPMDAVGKGMANPRFEADLFGARERLGLRVIEMTRAPREVLRSLREGRVVAILGDQNAHRGGVFVPFFGVLAATPRGPAVFAVRSGAPVFFAVTFREPGWKARYRVETWQIPFEPSGALETDTRTLLTRYMEAIEAAVERAPEQYFWQHKRWKTRPPEEQPRSG